KEHLICVFLECTSHIDRSYTRVVFKISEDRGRSWGEKRYLTNGTKGDDYFFDCPSIVRLSDDRILIVVNKVYRNSESEWGTFHEGVNELYVSDTEGRNWKGPFQTPVQGIVPDTICELASGRWL